MTTERCFRTTTDSPSIYCVRRRYPLLLESLNYRSWKTRPRPLNYLPYLPAILIMHQNGTKLVAIPSDDETLTANASESASPRPPLQWNWETEHADRKKERKADTALHGATPFEVDRRVLKDIVREKMGVDVGLITFLSAGTCSASRIADNRLSLTNVNTFRDLS